MSELTHVFDVMDRGRRRALNDAATLRFGVITAVNSGDVNVTLDDGAAISGVPVLWPYIPRVGATVRLAHQGSKLVVIGSVQPYLSTEAFLAQTSSNSVTATAFSSLPSAFNVNFTAPTSGRVIAHIKGRLTPTATARACATVRLKKAGAQTDIYTNPLLEVPAGGGTTSLGAMHLFTGLTPGDAMTAEILGLSGASGQTVTIAYLSLLIQPVM